LGYHGVVVVVRSRVGGGLWNGVGGVQRKKKGSTNKKAGEITYRNKHRQKKKGKGGILGEECKITAGRKVRGNGRGKKIGGEEGREKKYLLLSVHGGPKERGERKTLKNKKNKVGGREENSI